MSRLCQWDMTASDTRLRCATLLGVQVVVTTVQSAQFDATSENRGTLAKTLSKDYIPIQRNPSVETNPRFVILIFENLPVPGRWAHVDLRGQLGIRPGS